MSLLFGIQENRPCLRGTARNYARKHNCPADYLPREEAAERSGELGDETHPDDRIDMSDWTESRSTVWEVVVGFVDLFISGPGRAWFKVSERPNYRGGDPGTEAEHAAAKAVVKELNRSHKEAMEVTNEAFLKIWVRHLTQTATEP